MSKIYKIIVITSLALAIEAVFWSMWDSQCLAQAQAEIETLEYHREVLVKVLEMYQKGSE